MTDETPTPQRPRSRRVIDIEDRGPAPAPAAPLPLTPDNVPSEYANLQTESPSIRYKRIRAVEGLDAATEFIIDVIIRMEIAGTSMQEIARACNFSVAYTQSLLKASKAKRKLDMVAEFDGQGWLAEHMTIFREVRRKAFHVFMFSGATPMERDRAHSQLMSSMKLEADFIIRVGGLKVVSINDNNQDNATAAVRDMSRRMRDLTDAMEELMAIEPEEAEPEEQTA